MLRFVLRIHFSCLWRKISASRWWLLCSPPPVFPFFFSSPSLYTHAAKKKCDWGVCLGERPRARVLGWNVSGPPSHHLMNSSSFVCSFSKKQFLWEDRCVIFPGFVSKEIAHPVQVFRWLSLGPVAVENRPVPFCCGTSCASPSAKLFYSTSISSVFWATMPHTCHSGPADDCLPLDRNPFEDTSYTGLLCSSLLMGCGQNSQFIFVGDCFLRWFLSGPERCSVVRSPSCSSRGHEFGSQYPR